MREKLWRGRNVERGGTVERRKREMERKKWDSNKK